MNRKVLGALIAIVALASIAGIVVANQKSDGSDHTNTSQHSNDAGGSNTEGDTATETNTVAITDFDYKPGTITVKKGTTVTWTNNDSVKHTVTANVDDGPDSGLLAKGESYSYTFNEVGTYDYFCEPHPNMTGVVTVTE